MSPFATLGGSLTGIVASLGVDLPTTPGHLDPPTASGDAAPIGLIAGGNTTLDCPHGVDVDAQGRIYVPNQFGDSIAVFAPDATGSVAPVATISGVATGFWAPAALAVAPPLSLLTRHLPAGTVRHLTTRRCGPRWAPRPIDGR